MFDLMRRPRLHLCRIALATALVAVMMVAAAPFEAPAADAAGEAGPVATTHVLARLRPGATPAALDDGRISVHAGPRTPARRAAPIARQVAEVLGQFGATAFEPALSVQPANAALASQLGLDRTWRINVPAGSDTPALAARLSKFGDVFEYVETDALGGIATTVPNDPLFAVQYALRNGGQTVQGSPGVPGADVDATSAWDLTVGTSSTLLAVLDAGLDPHVELAGRTIPGWNSANGNTDTSDVCISHGTHVTGIAAATGDNGIGIAGMNWQTTIVPVRVFNFCQGNPASWLADGLIWAADHGADVINMSVQYGVGTTEMHDAVLYARGQGVILVAAAGNNPPAGVQYPGKYPETITVGATNNQDALWESSSTGPEVTVSAPGQSIYSLLDTTGYQYLSGTSMATPHVAGLATLMLSLDPSLTHDEVQSILSTTAEDLGAAGYDEQFGHGRIDAYAALVEVRRLMGDLDNSGATDIADLLLLLAGWGPCPPPSEPCPADLTGDGTVDIVDLLELLANWS